MFNIREEQHALVNGSGPDSRLAGDPIIDEDGGSEGWDGLVINIPGIADSCSFAEPGDAGLKNLIDEGITVAVIILPYLNPELKVLDMGRQDPAQ